MSDMHVSMHGGEGGVNPTPASIRALVATHGDGPVQMVNLLKFKDVASYPPGHEYEGSTGEEAYARYGEVAIRNVIGLGGRLVLASGFALCGLSSFVPVSRFGLLVSLAMLAALVADLLLVPVLLAKLSDREVARLGS